MLHLILSLSLNEQLKLGVLGMALIMERLLRGFLFFIYEMMLLLVGKDLLDFLYAKASFISSTFSYELDSSKPELSPTSNARLRTRKKLFMNSHELCSEMGIICQDYYVDTLDGFTLRLHRLIGNPDGPPVLLQHGLMMSDECFVFHEECSLARILFENGYDVWLGNNRGNKYSWKHEKFSRSQPDYWNFTIDDLARYDVPAMINCVLYFSSYKKITYLGFSNGCAQIFAAFQDNPGLSAKINHIIGLAPAVKVRGLLTSGDKPTNGFVYPFFFSPESKLFLRCFGNKAWLPSVDQWKRILTPARYVALLDRILHYMFNWTMDDFKVSYDKRCAFYYHLYSTTSTKHVHHWMQLIGQQQFVGYRPSSGTFMGDVETMDYDFRIIESVPLTCFVGKQDNLCDMEWMKRTFKKMKLIEVSGYEHLDFLCHNNIDKKVYQDVVHLLDSMDHGHGLGSDPLYSSLRAPRGSEDMHSVIRHHVTTAGTPLRPDRTTAQSTPILVDEGVHGRGLWLPLFSSGGSHEMGDQDPYPEYSSLGMHS